MDANSTIRLGLIGCGDIGAAHARWINGRPTPPGAWAPQGKVARAKAIVKKLLGRGAPPPPPRDPGTPGAEIVAGADVNADRLQAFGRRFGIEALYEDYRRLLESPNIDAVLICVPPKFHEQIAVDAANAGKHIFCEKPMAMTSGACTRMIEAAERNDVVLQIGYVLRFSEERGRIRRAVRDGELGRPVFWREITNLRSGPDPLWVHDAQVGGGPMYENSHALDFLLWTFGPVKTAFALTGRYKPEDTTAQDTISVMLQFESGDQAMFTDSYALPGFGWKDERCRADFIQFDVFGPNGVVQFPDRDHQPVLNVFRYGAAGDEVVDRQRWTSEFGADGYRREIETFIHSVRSGRRVDVATGRTSRQTLWLVEALRWSARTGEAVQFVDGRPQIDADPSWDVDLQDAESMKHNAGGDASRLAA